MNHYEGFVKRIIYQSPQTGYTIFILKQDKIVVRVSGYYPNLAKGFYVSIDGIGKAHPKHGFSLETKNFQYKWPTGIYDACDFLTSLIEDDYAEDPDPDIANLPFALPSPIDDVEYLINLMYRKFKNRIFDILIMHPLEVRGVDVQLDRFGTYSHLPIQLCNHLENVKRELDLSVFLYGIDPKLARFTTGILQNMKTRYELDEKNEIGWLKTNPYIFCRFMKNEGFSFPEADTIAKHFNLPEDSYERIEAGIIYAFETKVLSDGHVFATPEQYIEKAVEVLHLDAGIILEKTEELIDQNVLFLDHFGSDAYYLSEYYYMECDIAEKLLELESQNPGDKELVADFRLIEDRIGFSMDELQRNAIRTALNSSVTIITGGPGTGKSTIIKGLCLAFEKAGLTDIVLAAPTGRAALRMRETTGRSASTIHKLLGITPDSQRSEVQKIQSDVVIIDEVSMIDIPLMDKLLYAISPTTKLVLVGDVEQLPSVGPGYILHDIIESAVFTTVKLTKIYRQQGHSLISRNAKHVVEGEMIELSNAPDTDMHFISVDNREASEKAIIDLVRSLIAEGQSDMDIQVLTPVKQGLGGTETMNPKLKKVINPIQPDDPIFTTIEEEKFYARDRIMVTMNDYVDGIMNGEICCDSIVDIEDESGRTCLDLAFDDSRSSHYKEREYRTEWLTLAYAITVHKSQGSEYPIVIVPIFRNQNLYRNLIYTAMTRARNQLYFVGSLEDLKFGIDNIHPVERNTKLLQRIQCKVLQQV